MLRIYLEQINEKEENAIEDAEEAQEHHGNTGL